LEVGCRADRVQRFHQLGGNELFYVVLAGKEPDDVGEEVDFISFKHSGSSTDGDLEEGELGGVYFALRIGSDDCQCLWRQGIGADLLGRPSVGDSECYRLIECDCHKIE
jgi:hypothetical protein